MTQSNSSRCGDDRSGGAMFEEDVETAKSEFRLGDEMYSVQRVYIQIDEEGEV